MSTFAYNAEAQLNDGSAVLLDLEATGWANKELLSRTVRFSLLPVKDAVTMNGRPYPIVVVNIPEKGKPVFKSRVYGTIGVGLGDIGTEAFRAYAIGYKLGPKTYWTWVLPTGDIEVGEDPWLGDILLQSMKGNHGTLDTSPSVG